MWITRRTFPLLLINEMPWPMLMSFLLIRCLLLCVLQATGCPSIQMYNTQVIISSCVSLSPVFTTTSKAPPSTKKTRPSARVCCLLARSRKSKPLPSQRDTYASTLFCAQTHNLLIPPRIYILCIHTHKHTLQSPPVCYFVTNPLIYRCRHVFSTTDTHTHALLPILLCPFLLSLHFRDL